MAKTLLHRPQYESVLRRYLESDDVKVVTGVRRCGKSSLLALLADEVRKKDEDERNLLYLRFDDFGTPLAADAAWLEQRVLTAIEGSDQTRTFHIFLDEVQDVPGWEKVVRRLQARPNTDIFITGSNAYLLSSELATLLAGRYVELRVSPLSFSEYLAFVEENDLRFGSRDAAFSEYLRYGGMPGQFNLRNRTQDEVGRMLRGIYESIVLNDVARRAKVSDLDLLERLVRYVFSTSGNLFSTNKVVGALTSMGRKTASETVDSYLHALKSALVLGECEQCGLAGKKVLRPLRKFYPVDTGLRNLATSFSPSDVGFQLECVVYNELVRRGYAVSVGTLRTGEVDFVAKDAGGDEFYVQVCASLLDDNVYQRELAPLNAVRDSFPKMVVTLDRYREGTTETGVRIVNAVDWLLR